MKFGNVPDETLTSIDFKLVPDPFLNAEVLSGKRLPSPKIYVGSGNWGHASWVGKIYPPKTPASAFRNVFPNYFGAMELNATHYKIYPESVIREWATPAEGKDFKYCPKFPQSISHYSSFLKVDELTDAFIQSIAGFGENLGPAFLQVSDHFSPAKRDVLFGYLSSLPSDLDVFLELRHPDWFTDAGVSFSMLKEMKKGLVITDTPGRRDCAHMYLTIPKLFLRFVSNKDHSTTYLRITDWAQRIGNWVDQGLEEVYIFIHPGDETVIPELTVAWMEALNQSCKVNLKLPFIQQGSLF